MVMSEEEISALKNPEYWDERYSKAEGDEPTHEWFRSYSDLKPFFTKHLFEKYNAAKDPLILHLGAGDSVGSFLVLSCGILLALQLTSYRPYHRSC